MIFRFSYFLILMHLFVLFCFCLFPFSCRVWACGWRTIAPRQPLWSDIITLETTATTLETLMSLRFTKVTVSIFYSVYILLTSLSLQSMDYIIKRQCGKGK
uniref:(northern house mosquito) hypothetical protein n=1 Tax=Culex pipiens TaxID=7175 RepID=A0A8D8FWB1_CULPI